MDAVEILGSRKVAFAVFIVLSVVFLLPVFDNVNNWGSYDWDQHFFYHGSAYISLVKFHEFPFWNPFYCGGSPLLANPQSVFLSPFFLFVLLFGTVVGLKIQILVYLVVGLFGMFLLSRRLGLKILPSYLSAVVFMMSSWFFARVLVGHTTFLPFALLPWAFLFYLYSQEKSHYLVFSAGIFALMFLSGGIYPVYLSALFLLLYSFLESIEKKDIKPVIISVSILVFAVLFSAVKIVPMLQFTYGLSFDDVQYNSFQTLAKSILSRTQDVAVNDLEAGAEITDFSNLREDTVSGKVPWGWHEYSSYVGWFVVLLVLLSFFDRKNWKLIIIMFFFLLVSLGDFSPVPLWGISRQVPIIGGLHGPSRMLILFVFCAALLSGRALSSIRPINSRYIAFGITMIVLLDLFLVSRPLVDKAFTYDPVEIDSSKFNDYVHLISSTPFQSQFPNMLQGIDTVNCYERVHPKINVIPQFYDNGSAYEGFIGDAFLAGKNKPFSVAFSQNKASVDVRGSSGILVINQNYFPGWHSQGRKVFPYKGLVAANITPSDTRVVFYYSPETFYIGLVTSIAGILVAAYFAVKWRR
ncbi:hypothetical protein HYU11_05940 [Candidatus Woesearchaeota archaeon]|nr:hypothetical protein [Candidatus Woesearchaeota archaeon]